jgi:transcriptional regulator with XRE-family HTH domain
MKCPYCDGTGSIDEPSLGVVVTTMRKAAGLTQMQLSIKCGLSRGQIANLETDRTDLSLSALRRVAEALDCKVGDLFP